MERLRERRVALCFVEDDGLQETMEQLVLATLTLLLGGLGGAVADLIAKL